MRIGVIADVHMGVNPTDAVTGELRAVVERFNDDFRPDATVVLGDLIHDSTPAEDRENLGRVVETLDALDSPVTYLLGNHDVVNLPRETIRDTLGGDRWGRIGDTDLLYLDSSAPRLPDARGELDGEQLAFLRRELPRTDDGLAFVHHPIHYHDVRDNYWFGEHPERAFCGNKEEVTAIVEEHGGVCAVFNGHLHETDHTFYRGVHHFTINAFNRELPDAGVTGTYAEVVLGDRLAVRIVEGDRIERTFDVPV